MLYAIKSNAGEVVFEVAPLNVHEVDRTTRTDFAEKPIMGVPPQLEYVGEGGEDLTFRGRLFPQQLGGLADLATLHHMRKSGTAHHLMRGDGLVMGWFVIVEIREASKHLDGEGVGKVVDFEMLLKRSWKPTSEEYNKAQPVGSLFANQMRPHQAIANVWED